MYTKESPCLCSKYAKKLALTPRSTCVQTPYTPKKKSVEGQQLMASLPYPPSVSRAKRRLHQHAKKVLAKVRKYAACLIQNVVAFYLEFSHLGPLLPPLALPSLYSLTCTRECNPVAKESGKSLVSPSSSSHTSYVGRRRRGEAGNVNIRKRGSLARVV